VPAVGFAVWLSNELPARRDLTGVWLERGARARRSEIRSAHRGLDERDQEDHMGVIIGVDPHKGSHTAVAIGGDEARLAEVKVRASRRQVDQLLEWAARFEARTWAIESAGGLGYLVGQQLLNAGERVVDVPATLAARVRVLGTGRSNKNDPNDALSVAVAALRAPRLSPVARADHRGVLRLLAKRNNELGRARNTTACRLHWVTRAREPRQAPTDNEEARTSFAAGRHVGHVGRRDGTVGDFRGDNGDVYWCSAAGWRLLTRLPCHDAAASAWVCAARRIRRSRRERNTASAISRVPSSSANSPMVTATPRTESPGRPMTITPTTNSLIANTRESGQGGCSAGVVTAIVPPTMARKIAHEPTKTARLNRVGSGHASAAMPTPTSPATPRTAKAPERPRNGAVTTRCNAPRASSAKPTNAANDASVQSTVTNATPATIPTPPVTASVHGVDATDCP
jgi:Transposase